jgi:Amino acid synthesis
MHTASHHHAPGKRQILQQATLAPASQLEKLRLLCNQWIDFERGHKGHGSMKIKRVLTFLDEVRSDSGQEVSPRLRKVAAAAIVDNPFAGRFENDLSSLTRASEAIGREICAIAVQLLSPDKAVSYGKAATIGLNGEQEHGNAMLTTVFGNVMREAAGGGKAWISSMTKRGAPGSTIDVPLAHKDALYVRSHYDGMTITLPDAPQPDEIAIIAVYATRGSPNHRVGDIKGEDGLI